MPDPQDKAPDGETARLSLSLSEARGRHLEGFPDREGRRMLVLMLVIIDVALVASGRETAADRVIDRGVVKTLVGATAVQVGVIMLAIAGNLFPRPAPDARPWWRLW